MTHTIARLVWLVGLGVGVGACVGGPQPAPPFGGDASFDGSAGAADAGGGFGGGTAGFGGAGGVGGSGGAGGVGGFGGVGGVGGTGGTSGAGGTGDAAVPSCDPDAGGDLDAGDLPDACILDDAGASDATTSE